MFSKSIVSDLSVSQYWRYVLLAALWCSGLLLGYTAATPTHFSTDSFPLDVIFLPPHFASTAVRLFSVLLITVLAAILAMPDLLYFAAFSRAFNFGYCWKVLHCTIFEDLTSHYYLLFILHLVCCCSLLWLWYRSIQKFKASFVSDAILCIILHILVDLVAYRIYANVAVF